MCIFLKMFVFHLIAARTTLQTLGGLFCLLCNFFFLINKAGGMSWFFFKVTI